LKRRSPKIGILPPRALKKLIEESCFVIEVIDSINPEGTRSLTLERTVKKLGKPFLLVINKSDLLPRWLAEDWKSYYELKGYKVALASAKKGWGKGEIMSNVIKLAELCQKEERKLGVICGVPKTGKSSIINMLKGSDSAPTSRYPGKPGYTNSFTIYKIAEGIYIYDSPGVLPDPRDPLEKKIRTKPPEQLRDPVGPSIQILDLVKSADAAAVERLYGVSPQKSSNEILEDIAIKRGWREKVSKEPLVEQAAIRVIMDYLDGRLKILRKPPKQSSHSG